MLKVASWPLGYIILAAGDGRTYVLAESLATGVFVVLVWIGIPLIGVQATGLALIGQYVVYLPLVYLLARRRTGFGWTSRVKRHTVMLMIAAVAIIALGKASDVLAVVVGLLITLAFGLFSLGRLAHMSKYGVVTRVAAMGKSALTRMGLWRD